jgi:hypothetical protein
MKHTAEAMKRECQPMFVPFQHFLCGMCLAMNDRSGDDEDSDAEEECALCGEPYGDFSEESPSEDMSDF